VIVTAAALRASHCKVVEAPRSIVLGSARNVTVVRVWALQALAAQEQVAAAPRRNSYGSRGRAAPTGQRLEADAFEGDRLINEPPLNHCFMNPDHAGDVFLPVFVSCRTLVPSRIIEKICLDPVRDDSNAICRPSGAHVGLSLSPASCVICVFIPSRVMNIDIKIGRPAFLPRERNPLAVRDHAGPAACPPSSTRRLTWCSASMM